MSSGRRKKNTRRPREGETLKNTKVKGRIIIFDTKKKGGGRKEKNGISYIETTVLGRKNIKAITWNLKACDRRVAGKTVCNLRAIVALK